MSEVIDAGTQGNTEDAGVESQSVASTEEVVPSAVEGAGETGDATPQAVDALPEDTTTPEEAPESYTIPEGSEVEQQALDDVTDVSKELKLTNEQALDLAKRLQNRDKAVAERLNTEGLKANALIKQEIGDAAYAERVGGAKQVFAQIKPLNNMLEDHPWLANDPQFIDGLSYIYKQFIAEDKTNLGDPGHRPPARKSTAEKIFG